MRLNSWISIQSLLYTPWITFPTYLIFLPNFIQSYWVSRFILYSLLFDYFLIRCFSTEFLIYMDFRLIWEFLSEFIYVWFVFGFVLDHPQNLSKVDYQSLLRDQNLGFAHWSISRGSERGNHGVQIFLEDHFFLCSWWGVLW